MPIAVLTPEAAAKIAAGEVIGRPADVVRELLDNAIDAGATQIRVEIRAGGLQLIRVADNGQGIAAKEVPIAFDRHATSKITSAEDLLSVRTLGFRGEALPSIAAVADVTLVTKALNEPVGSFVTLLSGQLCEQGPRAASQGTTVSVRNLFHSVPARLKYLRAPAAEQSQIAHTVSEYALANPHVRFALVNDGRLAFQSDGTGRLQDAIVKVYGPEVASAMIPVEGGDKSAMAVSGFTSEPKITRASRGYISFFVNGRCIQNRLLAHAVEEAYHALLPIGRHPVAVICLRVPLEELDVNVHPTKAEVRFLRDRELYALVQRAVRHSLTATLSVPAMVSRPVAPIASVQQYLQNVTPVYHPLSGPQPREDVQATGASAEDPVILAVETAHAPPVLRLLGQVGAMFIIAEGPNGVFLIDQHRAHERVLYERFQRERASAAISTQMLLSPMPIELTGRQAPLFGQRLADLARLGFDIEPFGEQSFLLRAVPSTLQQASLGDSIQAIVDQAIEEDGEGNWDERMVATMACKGAIKSGQVLSMTEMRQLVEELEATAVPPTCPHGGPVMVHLSQAQLERHFGRR